jgi:hypothetical protein
MKYAPLSSIATLTLGIALSIASGGVGYAESASDLDTGFQSNEANSNYGTDLGTNFNPMNLIHQMNLNNGMNQQDFYNESQENINTAADDFKRQQHDRMLKQPETNTVPNTTTTDSNPEP